MAIIPVMNLRAFVTLRRIWTVISIISFVFGLQIATAQTGTQVEWPVPVNPHASPEARALLRYINSISGHYTLIGQHNYPNESSRWTDRAYDLTGKYPALFGQDFGFSAGDDKDSVESRPAMIEEVKRQYAHGAVIALTWHAVRPTDDEPVTFRDSVQAHLTDFEWQELLTPGTDLNKRWCAQVDVIAGYLKQLRDAHVPVLFRPYHEINGNWFWWGGRPGEDGSVALYRQIFDRFVNYHKLDNLVWVWNVNAPSSNAGTVADYYPGAKYADLVTMDIYGEFKTEYYTDMLALAAAKPIAMAEVGTAPTPEVIAQQPRWTYWMVWSNLVDSSNAVDSLNAVYHAPHMLGRDDPPQAEPMAATRKATAERTAGKPDAVPVTQDATPEAKAMLARLYSARGENTLSGQQNSSSAVVASTAAVVALTAKRPAIYGADLGVTSEVSAGVAATRRAIVDEAKREAKDHAVISFVWYATRPTDDEPASYAKSVRGQLTDFEWNELLTPGTKIYQRWCTQVDEVAASLKQLQDAGVAVLWQPYPMSNGKNFWWAGRKGNHGSAALYRQIFERMVNHDGLHNLVWVWDAAPPGFGPGGPGSFSDFFPGLLYVDALAVDVDPLGGRFRADTFLTRIGVDKVIGLGLSGKIPPPDVFTQQPIWAWFMVAPVADPSAIPADQQDALRKLYEDSRIVSLAAAEK